ncbi:MAG TPA: TRAP transporter fused permease subunit [Sphaerochaeta sp.]|nr:TRAP transporter fused permease subunit [Sphaerochaeta sp.]
MRELKGWVRWLVAICLAAVALFHFYTAVFGIFQPRIQRGVHLMVLLPMAFLLYPAHKEKSPTDRPSLLDWVLAVMAVIPPIYLMMFNRQLDLRYATIDPVTTTQLVLGLINIILIIEGVRRAVVPALAILIVAFFAYIFAAPYLPGIFWARAMPISRIVEINYLLTNEGIYGSIIGVTATFVSIFVIFGAFLQNTNTGEYFTKLAVSVAGKSIGGPAKIAVISSGLFGSISGVAAANVYATGVFTIPLMKRMGYRKQFAGAVEASASTGGLIMPPIMGAGAFVMSEITGIAYVHIIKAAVLGAIFYYFSILLRVHYIAKKEGLKSMEAEEVIPLKQILKDSYLLLPLVILVVFLSIGYSPFIGAVWGIVATYVLTFFKKETRMGLKKLFETFELSGQNLIMLAMSCAGAGMVISTVTYTGLALGIASSIQAWSGGFLFPALLLVMITSILMGMGMPCTPAYIVAITIGGPALQAMGVDVLTAHLFVFYFAILAEVTPPVSIAAYCGAAIAGSDPLKTGWEALSLALVGFIIPYIFVYNPAFMLKGSFFEIIAVSILVFYATLLLSSSMAGYWTRALKVWERGALGLVTAAMVVLACNKVIMHSAATQIFMVASLAVVIFFFVRKGKSSTAVVV